MDSRRNGFTMVEMLVTVAIFAIMAAIALPSYTTIIANNRADTETGDFYRALNYARLEAINRGLSVRITPSTSGVWTSALNITLSSAGTSLRVIPAMSSSAALSFSTTAAYIEFNNLGGLTFPASALTLTYTQGTVSRNLGVCLNGRVVLSGTCT
ncbi:GspH/FimT family pseudopilin [Pseudomonas sp.]|uniref:GspH/FimT family pseudopilin n=1 Tax=Pseudomonas sp. TaxID=306 RepID=UPI003CC5B2A8